MSPPRRPAVSERPPDLTTHPVQRPSDCGAKRHVTRRQADACRSLRKDCFQPGTGLFLGDALQQKELLGLRFSLNQCHAAGSDAE